jgi:hypothetical protein
MSDNDKLRSQVDRGETARIVLAELSKAFEAIDKAAWETFKRCPADDTAGQARLKSAVDMAQRFHNYFANYVRVGEDAHKELARIMKQPSKLKRAIGIL